MWLILYALLIYQLAVLPVHASYVFDGNDHIDSANDAVTGINDDTASMTCWVKVTAQPAGQQIVVVHATTISAGNFRTQLALVAPSSSGFKFAFTSGFATAGGTWANTTDLPLNTWVQIGADFDMTSAANDPNLVVNGAVVANSETATPSGAAQTGDDSIRFGEDLGGTSDLVAKVAECAFYSSRLSASDWAILGTHTPGAVSTNRVYYLPFKANATDSDGATGAMTVTGAVLSTTDHPLLSYPRGGPVMFP